MGAGLRPPLLLHRHDTDHVYMGRIVVNIVTAPLWVPTYVGIVVVRWIMGPDQSDDAF